MINDHICKVCGREASEGSDAYNFMVHRLEEYRAHVEAKCKRDAAIKSIDEESLFKMTILPNYIHSVFHSAVPKNLKFSAYQEKLTTG